MTGINIVMYTFIAFKPISYFLSRKFSIPYEFISLECHMDMNNIAVQNFGKYLDISELKV